MSASLATRFQDALDSYRPDEPYRRVEDLTPWSDPRQNQLLMFVKPEITSLGSGARASLDLIADHLSDRGCVPDSITVLSPRRLRDYRLIEDHYGLISTYSRKGAAALPPAALREFEIWRSELGLPDLELLGAHQVLEAFDGVTAADLLQWHHDSRARRLASGAYAFVHAIDGKQVAIIDGFHPAQIGQFYDTDAPLLIATLRSTSNWRGLRRSMVGATNPKDAEPGSIRAELLARCGDLGIAVIDSMRNGIHLSAGPLEALVEIERYLSNPLSAQRFQISDANLGAELLRSLPEAEIRRLMANEPVPGEDGLQILPYDFTEERDTEETIRLLTGAGLGR